MVVRYAKLCPWPEMGESGAMDVIMRKHSRQSEGMIGKSEASIIFCSDHSEYVKHRRAESLLDHPVHIWDVLHCENQTQ